MTRAAIYARFSDAKQNGRSIEDQLALCRDHAARQGWTVAGEFVDRAISGSRVVTRPGYQALLAAARGGQCDVILAEDLDRLVRNQAEQARLYEEMSFCEIAIHTVLFGLTTEIHVGMNGTMNALQLKQIAAKVRRAQAGVVKSGRIGGGRSYGYRPTPGKPGVFAIDDAEAGIVREIFTRYAAGETPRAIARDLNARGIPSPRGGQWNASTINGNHRRRSGMLFNELYIGRIVWNRQRYAKNPATERRNARPNAETEWHRAEAPHLRILDDDLWRRARAVKAARHNVKPQDGRKPRRLLSGLIRCGCCGGGMGAVARDKTGMRLQCTSYRERGTCESKAMVYRARVEQTVIAGLRALIADRASLDRFMATYRAEHDRLRRRDARDRARIARRAGEVAREIGRTVDAIVKIGDRSPALPERLISLEAEQSALRRQLAAIDAGDRVVTLHPAAIDRHRQALDDMAALLDRPAEAGDLIAAIRRLIAKVIIHPDPAGGRPRIEVVGRLADLTGAAAISRGMVVAGDRNRQYPTEPIFSIWLAA